MYVYGIYIYMYKEDQRSMLALFVNMFITRLVPTATLQDGRHCWIYRMARGPGKGLSFSMIFASKNVINRMV